MLPIIGLNEAEWIACGIGSLGIVTFSIYWLYPSMIKRRGALKKLTEANYPELVEALHGLCGEIHVTPPTFMLAPYATTTTTAMTFGHVRHRFVKLDAGLVVLSHTKPATFRAVVLHELAHLRNRDVDITYLTVGLWWSFAVIAIPSMLTVAIASRLSVDAQTWHLDWWGTLRVSASLLALTTLILLTRNALLRVREHYADARVDRWEKPTSGMALRDYFTNAKPAAVHQLSIRGRWGHHPRPARRVEVMNTPALLSQPRLWELFAVGMVAALFMENGFLLLQMLLPTLSGLANLLVVLIVAAGGATTLVLAVWRSAVSSPQYRPPLRILLYPLLLIAGFLVGEATALVNTAAGPWVLFSQYGHSNSFEPAFVLTTIAPLLIGGLLLVIWARSAVSGVLYATRTSRSRTVLAFVTAVVITCTPWLEVWLTLRSDVSQSVAAALGKESRIATPHPEGLASGHSVLLKWIEQLTLWPKQHLFLVASSFVPWVLVGIILLWLVPIVAIRRATRFRGAHAHVSLRTDTKRALLIGVTGGTCCLFAFLVELFAVKSAYDPVVHRPQLTAWLTTNMDAYIAITILIGALTAATAMIVLRQLRVILSLLALFVSGTLATGVVWLGAQPGNCMALLEAWVSRCGKPLPFVTATEFWHAAIVFSILAAVPVTILGTAVAAIFRSGTKGSHREPQASGDQSIEVDVQQPGLRLRVGSTATAITLIAVILAAAFANQSRWITFTYEETPADCLIGTWVETAYNRTLTLDNGITVGLSRSGGLHRFRDNGLVVLDFGSGNTESGLHNGAVVAIRYTGSLRRSYQVVSNLILYENPISNGSKTSRVDKKIGSTRPLIVGTTAEEFSCSRDQLELRSALYTTKLKRISRTG
nr:M48 family metalloprotease [Kibdelosporangium sp. MJ126-NF4]